ncbi:MAG TPA: molybdate ABC transporter substrate-binding protein [Bryobacteraceae bacterium]|nr:molybdate ABC transporter substrate-binding protein [Bryobacteraceae bacterium]
MVSRQRHAGRQIAALLLGCLCCFAATGAELHVAAASNLNRALAEICGAFEHQTGIHVVPTFGATAQLAQQIENGAPFDVLMAADVEHVDEVIGKGAAASESRTIYARGRLAIWAPARPELKTLAGLADPSIRIVVIAKPELAPYGAAAVEALRNAGLWDKVRDKVVYAPSVSVAKQFADTGNGDAAFTASSLIAGEKGNTFLVDEKLHKPIDQALCIVKASKEQANARAFVRFLAGPEGKSILKRYGYL